MPKTGVPMKHPALDIFHKRDESYMYDCQRCGEWFHTCGDDPEALCKRCRNV